jgi:hypothetical protein
MITTVAKTQNPWKKKKKRTLKSIYTFFFPSPCIVCGSAIIGCRVFVCFFKEFWFVAKVAIINRKI